MEEPKSQRLQGYTVHEFEPSTLNNGESDREHCAVCGNSPGATMHR